MAARAIHQLLKRNPPSQSTSFRALALLGAGVSGLSGFATIAYAEEAGRGLECPSYPWPHNGILSAYDNGSVRRGQQIFRQDCSSCHSASMTSYRDLSGVVYTEGELKALAAEIEVVDGLGHRSPQAYENEAAKFSNGRAYPTDLSLITKARNNGQNSVFNLLTSRRDPPSGGVSILEGLHYNPYFRGGAISMPKMLIDRTPTRVAQMGKDDVPYLDCVA